MLREVEALDALPQARVTFRLTAALQTHLVRLILTDPLMSGVLPHVRPKYFDNPNDRYLIGQIAEYYEAHGAMPTQLMLQQLAYAHNDPCEAHNLCAYIETMFAAGELDDGGRSYVGAEVVRFLRHQYCRDSVDYLVRLFNGGDDDAAVARIPEVAQELEAIRLQQPDLAHTLDVVELQMRETMRRNPEEGAYVSTGLAALDEALGGYGLERGRVGMWMAYLKTGKTALLVHLGAHAALTGHRVLHFVLEGTREETELRYDAWFSGANQTPLKHHQVAPDFYADLAKMYAGKKDNLIVRAFTDESTAWDTDVGQMVAQVKDLKKRLGWKPDLIIIDYLELVAARPGVVCRSPHEKEIGVIRDIKTFAMATKTAIWTATQARRGEGQQDENKPVWLSSGMVGGSIEKPRAVDFFGSINRTQLEKTQHVVRLFCEHCRLSAGGERLTVRGDMGTCRFWEEDGLVSPHKEMQSVVHEDMPRFKQGRAF